MIGAIITFLVLIGATVALGYLSGQASMNPKTHPSIRTVTNVSFVFFIVMSLIYLFRMARTFFIFGVPPR